METLRGVHYFAPPEGQTATAEFIERNKRRPLASEHQLVRLIPEIGEKRISGLTPSESQHLLELLWEYITQPEYTVRFRWQPGSFAFWDNRTTSQLRLVTSKVRTSTVSSIASLCAERCPSGLTGVRQLPPKAIRSKSIPRELRLVASRTGDAKAASISLKRMPLSEAPVRQACGAAGSTGIGTLARTRGRSRDWQRLPGISIRDAIARPKENGCPPGPIPLQWFHPRLQRSRAASTPGG